MTKDELKNIIRCIHRLYYSDDFLKNPKKYLEFHRHMEDLFNYAGITSTLVSNNPDEVSPDQLAHAIAQGWVK